MNNHYKSTTSSDYPSPADVKLYIGGAWLDDAYRVDYNVSTSRTPLYDYTSKFFKDVAEGHTIIQGQLIINFRFPNYLKYAISNTLERDPQVNKAMNESFEIYQMMTQGTPQKKLQNLLELKKRGAIKPAKQVMAMVNGSTQIPDSTNLPISQSSMTSFDIRIGYGGDNAKHIAVLKNCIITGEGQVISAAAIAGGDLSSSSLPIFEIYNFFAKKIEYDNTIRQNKTQLNG
jgi:hypothetical protein